DRLADAAAGTGLGGAAADDPRRGAPLRRRADGQAGRARPGAARSDRGASRTRRPARVAAPNRRTRIRALRAVATGPLSGARIDQILPNLAPGDAASDACLAFGRMLTA